MMRDERRNPRDERRNPSDERRNPTDERGNSTVELGMILPIALLVLAVTVPVLQAGWSYLVLSRAAAEGARYATRVDPNARYAGCGDGALTRRPHACEVDAFVRDAAGPLSLEDVRTAVDGDPAVEPSDALPGELVEVRATYTVAFPAAGVANALMGTDLLPERRTITVTATGREE